MLQRIRILAASAVVNFLIPVSPLLADGPDEISFNLVANPKFAACLVSDPNEPAPSAKVTVSRGNSQRRDDRGTTEFQTGSGLRSLYDTAQPAQVRWHAGPQFQRLRPVLVSLGHSRRQRWTCGSSRQSILLDGIFGFDGDPVPAPYPPRPWFRPLTRSTLGFGLTARKTPPPAALMSRSQHRSTRFRRPGPMA
jgi:hypothetical protein